MKMHQVQVPMAELNRCTVESLDAPCTVLF